jgi:hypothetical protein
MKRKHRQRGDGVAFQEREGHFRREGRRGDERWRGEDGVH